MNIHFDNFGYNELVSRNSKDKLKKYIKSNIDINKDIKLQLDEKNELILEKYFKKVDGKNINLNYKIDGINIYFNLEIKDKLATQKEINKYKLRKKIEQAKNNRYIARERNNFLENEKNEKKMLSDDPRVTNEMIQKYNLAKNKFGNQLPNPITILDDKPEHVKKYVDYVGMIIKNSKTEEQMMTMLDNEYSHYVNVMTGFDYKAIIDSFKQNMEKVKKEPVFEKLDEIKEEPVFEKLD